MQVAHAPPLPEGGERLYGGPPIPPLPSRSAVIERTLRHLPRADSQAVPPPTLLQSTAGQQTLEAVAAHASQLLTLVPPADHLPKQAAGHPTAPAQAPGGGVQLCLPRPLHTIAPPRAVYRSLRRWCLHATLAWLAGVLLLLSACSSASTTTAGQPSATARPSPSPSTQASATSSSAAACAVQGQAPPHGNIAASFATALAFAPDGRLFWTERSGTVRVWQDGAARVFATVKTVTTERDGGYSERGLLGLALSPTFSTDRFVYAFYSDVNYTQQHVMRWRDCRGRGLDPTVVVTLPAGADCCHKGGRLAFGTDGMLYVTLGEEHAAAAAQNTGDVRGKLLRYRPDGSVPPDNPFGPTNPVWAYGLRNPFGLAVSAATGQMAVTSNGPSGDVDSPATGYDIVILAVARGRGYQWPDCYGYSHPLATAACPAGQSPPDYSSEQRTLVPTGAAFIDAAGPPPVAGHLVFCSLNAGMQIVTPGSPHATVQSGPGGCRLDVKEGPDHAVYFSDPATIYRLG